RVAVGKAIAGRDALVAQGGFLELERLGRRAELQIRSAVEPRADVLEILLDVPERERHGAILWRHSGTLAQARVLRPTTQKIVGPLLCAPARCLAGTSAGSIPARR